jgi:hypothetical protein
MEDTDGRLSSSMLSPSVITIPCLAACAWVKTVMCIQNRVVMMRAGIWRRIAGQTKGSHV